MSLYGLGSREVTDVGNFYEWIPFDSRFLYVGCCMRVLGTDSAGMTYFKDLMYTGSPGRGNCYISIFLEKNSSVQYGEAWVLINEGVPHRQDLVKFISMPLVDKLLKGITVEDCARYIAGGRLDEMLRVHKLYSSAMNESELPHRSQDYFAEIYRRVAVLKLNGTLAKCGVCDD